MITQERMPGSDATCAIMPSRTEQSTPIYGFPRWKRVLDVTLVVLSLPVVVPVGICVAAFIKLVSPGPAFFRQRRVGLNGQTFMCVKFRTMKVNADTGVHQAHLKELMTSNRPTRKLDCAGDKRLVSGGVALRALGVDELPQLFNVLHGEMSLVGPRPCTPYEYDLYTPRHRKRCEAPPGLTGLWQISGKNRTTFEQMIDLDLEYVKRTSLWLDLKIIFLTVPAILLLVWEMKLSPAARARRHSQNQEKEQSSSLLGSSGTAAARE